MVTVEADQVRVESRLAGGQFECPGCGGAAPWGCARPRGVRGVGPLRPRRARCAGCLVTHVLLPVTVLLRRADAAAVIWAAMTARAAGGSSEDRRCCGCRHRRSADGCGGWPRVWRWCGCIDAGSPPGRGRHGGAESARVAMAGRGRRGGRGDGGGDRPVRAGRGDRPGDGVAGAVGVVVVGCFHLVGRPVCRVPVPTRVAPDARDRWSGIVAKVIARQHLGWAGFRWNQDHG